MKPKSKMVIGLLMIALNVKVETVPPELGIVLTLAWAAYAIILFMEGFSEALKEGRS